MKKSIEEMLMKALEQAYRDIQDDRGITSGDIEPLMSHRLEVAEKELVKQVELWLTENK
jgi:hypothetical protein